VLASVSLAQTPLTTVRVASGLSNPVFVTAPDGDYDRLFIVEYRQARIKILDLDTGSVLSTPFLDIDPQVESGGNEQGLLGLAFHPDYENNGFFYVNYTQEPNGATVVERFSVSAGDPNVADSNSGFVIFGPNSQPFTNHNGGCILFSPLDGYLYIGMGDGGSANDPNCRAQKGGNMKGKMLRLDVDGGSPYAIPADNPFIGDPGFNDEIWDYGLRNPWRFSFDRLTGDMYIGDVGQNAREEIDFRSAATPGGLNFGWKMMEGFACNSSSSCPGGTPACGDASLVDPIKVYDHGLGCSVTGGYIYRGCAIPDLEGTYFYADYCSGRIWSFGFDGVTKTDFQERTNELAPGGGLNINSITSFGEDAEGEIYIVDQGGEVFKIVPNAPAPAVDLGFGKIGGNGLVPELSMCGLLDSGNSADIRLRDAPPLTLAALFVGFTNNPTPGFGGTLVPVPPFCIHVYGTDANGDLTLTAPGGGGVFDVFLQYLILDAGATTGMGLSNAIQATFQP
jgi:glucose/arabinose dehydrogenase